MVSTDLHQSSQKSSQGREKPSQKLACGEGGCLSAKDTWHDFVLIQRTKNYPNNKFYLENFCPLNEDKT